MPCDEVLRRGSHGVGLALLTFLPLNHRAGSILPRSAQGAQRTSSRWIPTSTDGYLVLASGLVLCASSGCFQTRKASSLGSSPASRFRPGAGRNRSFQSHPHRPFLRRSLPLVANPGRSHRMSMGSEEWPWTAWIHTRPNQRSVQNTRGPRPDVHGD